MNNIRELTEIIKDLGGKASFKEICDGYQKRNKIVLSSNHKITLGRTLKDNPDIVFFDGNQWVLNNKPIKKIVKPEAINESEYLGFSFASDSSLEYQERVDRLITKFIKKYPIDKIKNMTFDEYAISPKGTGNDSSFCRMLRYDLQNVCSMGNAFPATFEIYKDGEGNIKTSSAVAKEFGDDYERAFSAIKRRIVEFLDAAGKKDTKRMNQIRLNSAFKQKLAVIYFSDIYFHAAVKEYIRQSCIRLGITYDEENVFSSMLSLVDWKNKRKDISGISNSILMRYTDYLIRLDLSMSSIKIDNPYKKPEKIAKKYKIG